MYKEEVIQLFDKNIVLSNEMIRSSLMLEKEQYAVLNTELKRMCDEKFIERVGHGTYIMPKKTRWGLVYPTENEMAYHFYVVKDTGYLSGSCYYNEIGISTWVPNKREITTNKYRYKLRGLKNTELVKPKITITKENRKYLQILDGIHYLERHHCDAPDPIAVFAEQILQNNLDEIKLVLIANALYPKYVLEKVLKAMEMNHSEISFQ